MKFLFPGQRVRVVCQQSDIYGRETNILRLGAHGAYKGGLWDSGTEEFDNGVEVNERLGPGNKYPYYVFKPEDVEPIIPFEDFNEYESTEELENVL